MYSVEQIDSKTTGTGKQYQRVKLAGVKDWVSNFGVKVQVGDQIEAELVTKGNFTNLMNIQFASSTPEPRSIVPQTESIVSVVTKAQEIMLACVVATKQVFGVKVLEPHHIACVNSMYIYAAKKIN